ncbi:uncharacterized protein CANTADRAFT_24728 [Suhomyces tanzawaensis NRRL Y-17324]|uniref:Uncharacterized protein n=1 Tax=Suhomyces tanzawaensis NRRL Y-17324 TaxID=984487 RepID=A0A1E4SRA6_9ASCO|nr:uncharacterized protein CANTADRAFT_24728 [Suhomyces tanzawaensis NRRL Y-17324]ODV82046.1 hypothetical protein CANTADRAFT_24728 [Suhomyces tanzawaensis NRRL Y-17324]
MEGTYLVFLINKEIPTSEEEFEYEGFNYYENLEFHACKKEKEVKKFLMHCDPEKYSEYYFVVHEGVKAKHRLYSRYRADMLTCLGEITNVVGTIETLFFWQEQRFDYKEGMIVDKDDKVNVYTEIPIEVDDEKLRVIPTQPDEFKGYKRELKFDHWFPPSYHFYVTKDKIYKKNVARTLEYQEEYDISQLQDILKGISSDDRD